LENPVTPRLKPVSDQVIVITGASSGIGLATARMAARRGAAVVLAARTEQALNEAVREITMAEGRAVAVVCDVRRRDELERLADEAVRNFGRIDTWVNNAGVGIWGRIEEVSETDMRQLFETNFWGEVAGSLVALPHLKRQGGALINMGSMGSDRALPLQGIYSASKHAVMGFTDALRMELEEEGAPVSVTLIKPASVGTPMPQHVRNYTRSEPKFPPPVYAPEDVAKVILLAAARPLREAFVGGSARAISTLAKLAPRLLDRVSESTLFKGQVGPKSPSPGDNLWHGRSEGKVRGDHQGSIIRPSLYSNATVHAGLTTAVAGLALAGLVWLARSGRTNGALGQSRPSTDEPFSAGQAGVKRNGKGEDGAWPASTGPNARPLEDSIAQAAAGLPDDISRAVESSPDEERRITEKIEAL
jgi:short-subunit dehydrogenase